ncbi:MAG: hypothetical protein OM95_16720 [Bdellovibrio sp. ArHS]|uniref:hypothetical protein n=1 Tax=Bdellovibrio sp. ArHS TaxID=1569284 RepID=UPI000583AE2C|nr:hypothetical protein [Bdellovibrio sp. ArHS]KHD87023.1 MAG: hypothetical protein OM95_16720 [Bdellovibrio sp. ArHS]
MNTVLSFILFTLFSCTSFAQESTCLKARDVERIQKKIKISLQGTDNYCDPNNPKYTFVNAILFIEGLDLKGPIVPSPWNQDILPSRWQDYFFSRIKEVRNGSNCGPAMAYVVWNNPAMYLCPVMQDSAYSSVTTLVGTMMHEARHVDGYGHEKCEEGQYKGQRFCDKAITDKGSYAVSIEVFSKLAVSARNIHPSLKQLSLDWALLYTDQFINKFTNVKPIALLQEDSGNTYIFDGSQLSPVATKSIFPEGQFLPRNSLEWVFLPKNHTHNPVRYSVLDTAQISPVEPQGSFMQDYLKSPLEDRRQYKDVVYGSSTEYQLFVQLKGNTLLVENSPIEVNIKVNGPWGEAIRLFTAQDYNATAKNRIYVLNEKDEVFRVEIESNTYKVTKIENPAPGIVAITNLGANKYGLNRNGQLFKRVDGRYTLMKDFKDRRFKSLSRSGEMDLPRGSLVHKYLESLKP